jgi:hypothetical protein
MFQKLEIACFKSLKLPMFQKLEITPMFQKLEITYVS